MSMKTGRGLLQQTEEDGANLQRRLAAVDHQLLVGCPELAYTRCIEALRLYPAAPEILARMVDALLQLGKLHAAKVLVGVGLALQPIDINLRHSSLRLNLMRGDLRAASQDAEIMMQTSPNCADLHLSLDRLRHRVACLKVALRGCNGQLLSSDDAAALAMDFQAHVTLTPIIINSRDRVTCLRTLLTWFRDAGYRNIAVLDNASTYPPLVDYLSNLPQETVRVLRLPENMGHKALWVSGLCHTLLGQTWFVYTDPDVLPVDDCPKDIVWRLHSLLKTHCSFTKAGLGLKINDIPDCYVHKCAVQAWEQQFWTRPLPGSCYAAPVDTTLALYRPGVDHSFSAVRTAYPYLVRHLPWYADSCCPNDELVYYLRHAERNSCSWSTRPPTTH